MHESLSETLTTCRVCGSGKIEEVLDLGRQPPANSLRSDPAETLPEIPLVLCRCDQCGTVQLTETVRPDYLFRNYVWVTGTSEVARKYSRIFCERLAERCEPAKLFVVEVASNDGTFLQRFRERGDVVLGVDPAQNIAATANEGGIETIADFFGMRVARRIVTERGEADAVFARNVIPHVADVNDVVGGMAHCLSDKGVGAIEFHRADRILDELHYDSVYHEHVAYHSLHSIMRLLDQHGLSAFDVSDSPINGGSMVVYFSKMSRVRSTALTNWIEQERRLKINERAPWLEFARRCREHREVLLGLVEACKKKGQRLIGYGASARGSTLLNYAGIDHSHLDAIADKSPLKHDRYAPGTNVLITSPPRAFALKPDAVLLLAWNFRAEILGEIAADLKWRGEVISPLPGAPVLMHVG